MITMRKSQRSAFTVVELMIVVAIIADLVTVAVPAFMRSRNLAQEARYISDMRTASGAFEMYAAENNSYPPAAQPGITPNGMLTYLGDFPWSDTNSVGGQWVWSPGYKNCTAVLLTTFPYPMDELEMADVDQRMDDGVLATGSFREVDSQNFYYILEP